ncbi:hypothetical protein LOK49_Contig57G00010 [Camellia lanceoleosa]|nr:hypothetical protein LOK49_Contig57G00010 [Camellia lanceoleosa]
MIAWKMWLTLLFQKQKCRKLTCFMSQTSPSLKLKYKVPREEMTLRYMTQREQWVTQVRNFLERCKIWSKN